MYGEKANRKKDQVLSELKYNFHEPKPLYHKTEQMCVLLLMTRALWAREGNRIDCSAS